MANKPCLNPKLCGVQSHRPGTFAACAQPKGAGAASGSVALAAPPSLSKGIPEDRQLGDSEVEALAEFLIQDNYMIEMGEILNRPHSTAVEGQMWRRLTNRLDDMGLEYSNEDGIAIEKLIRAEAKSRIPNSKGTPGIVVEIGEETMKEHRAFTRDKALYVDAGEESLIVVVEDKLGQINEEGQALLMTAGSIQLHEDGDLNFADQAVPIYRNSDGELWVRENMHENTNYIRAVRLSDLKEGDRHPVEEEWELEPSDGDKFDIYKACRRLEANSDVREWVLQNSILLDPEGYKGHGGAYIIPSQG